MLSLALIHCCDSYINYSPPLRICGARNLLSHLLPCAYYMPVLGLDPGMKGDRHDDRTRCYPPWKMDIFRLLGKGGQRGGAKEYEGLMIKAHCNSEEPVLVSDGGGRLPGHPAAIVAKQIPAGPEGGGCVLRGRPHLWQVLQKQGKLLTSLKEDKYQHFLRFLQHRSPSRNFCGTLRGMMLPQD